ncbi:hypothetical protein SAMN05216588_109174 [Pseudomonas flavescens]|uniref:Uncharacterized protein n=1 Tax=Phytopseudomonas flavescens TaxID=29435 RepID=A0A1G8GSJ7_9GAMM|nr:hypothetical protein SAMN05216588_109174 [Pseudomonas flavescens]
MGCLDLNLHTVFGDGVIAFIRCGFKFKRIRIRDQTLPKAADHMAIRGEMPTGEHCFQFSDRGVQLPNQHLEFFVIDHKH